MLRAADGEVTIFVHLVDSRKSSSDARLVEWCLPAAEEGCTSRNAGDFLPVFAPWRGCSRAASVPAHADRRRLQVRLFDKTLGNAFHGLVAADTGSGKSVSLGALTIDALAAGLDAILVDNGGAGGR